MINNLVILDHVIGKRRRRAIVRQRDAWRFDPDCARLSGLRVRKHTWWRAFCATFPA